MSSLLVGPWDSEETLRNKEAIRSLLLGHTVTKVFEDTLLLDDGRLLQVVPTDGCGGCPSGYFWINELNEFPVNAITAVEFTENDTEEDDAVTTLRVFVLAHDTRFQLLEVEGKVGNGCYTSGYWIQVKVAP